MKKDEAELLAVKRVNLIIEYITNILNDDVKVSGDIVFGNAKIGSENMCTVDILVPQKNFERHLNLGIPFNHVDIFHKRLFDQLLVNYLDSDSLGVGRFVRIYTSNGSFRGLKAVSSSGNVMRINFHSWGSQFQEITKEYNDKIEIYRNNLVSKNNEEEIDFLSNSHFKR